jgi:CBS domain-containing protein
VTALMRANGHSCVVVAESRLGPLGVITERDLVDLLAKSYADGRVDDGIASDMMS